MPDNLVNAAANGDIQVCFVFRVPLWLAPSSVVLAACCGGISN